MKSAVDSIWEEQARRQKESTTLSLIKRCEGELERLNARRETIEKEIINCLMGESKLTGEALNCYYSLYLQRVRQLIVRFYEGVFPEFDVKHVTIDTAYIFTLIEELYWRVYANVVYPG